MMHAHEEASRHRCLIYEGQPSEQLPVIVPLLAESLRENRRCLYLGDPGMVGMLRDELFRSGVDVGREAARGALVFSSDRSHLDGGSFDPAMMVEMLRGLVDAAVKDGYSGLWASGDMRWELGSDENFERLEEYEARLERVFRDRPLAGVCQYHRTSVPPDALRAALTSHRSAYIGRALHADNLFYVPPELLLAERDPAEMADWMWRQVSRVVDAEQKRDQSLRELAELNDVLERRVAERTSELESFSYSVSHDLRAPLRAIDAFCRDIRETQAARMDAAGRADLERVLEAAGRMGRFIDAMLEVSKLSRARPERENVDLSKLASTVVADLRKADPRRLVTVIVAPGLSARGDARLLGAALGNLLGNAWKFTGGTPDARLEFGSVTLDGRPAFFVRDNGAGFDMGYRSSVFKPFQRFHSAESFPGFGIGLANAQRIVSLHGGELWAESKPGKGATFYFTLPSPLS